MTHRPLAAAGGRSLLVTPLLGDIEGCLAVSVLPRRVRPRRQQALHHLDMALTSSCIQRRQAFLIGHVHVRPRRQQALHHRDMALTASYKHRCTAGTTGLVYVRPAS